MNYLKLYNNIIDRAKTRTMEGYKETHHIIPKSCGGTDDKFNLVDLTAKEHFICHLLLAKIYENDIVKHKKCVRAFIMMLVCESGNQKRYITSKQYQNLKEKFSKIQSQEQSGVGNSQHGTMWIHSIELKKSKKIKKTDEIPNGWDKGYIVNFDSFERKIKEKALIALNNEKIYGEKVAKLREWHNIYKDVGFDEFVKITGYTHSKPNLVKAFSRHVPEFVPQNGKPRKKKVDS